MKRASLLIGGIALFVVASKLLFENVLGLDLEPMVREWTAQPGVGAAAVIAGLLVLDIVFPIPSSLVMILSGVAFGVWWGALVALAGSIGGEWLGFEVARVYGRRAAAWLVGEEDLDRLSRLVARHGAAAVVITRALPIVMETMSVAAGLSSMSRRTFLAASLVGTAPIVVVYAWAGSASREAGTLVPAVVITLAVAGCGWILYRAKMTEA